METKNYINNVVTIDVKEIKQDHEETIAIKTEYDSDSELITECKEIFLRPECMELYEDHIIKEEFVIGPEVMLETCTKKKLGTKDDYEKCDTKPKPKKKSKWVCNLCNREFVRKAALTKHEKYNCPMNPIKIINQKWHTCNICNKEYGRKDILAKHLQTHDTNPVKYHCECGKIYSTKDALRNHINVKHLNNKNDTTCYFCNKELNDKTYRNYHIKYFCPNNQNRIKPPEVTCKYCNKVLCNKYSGIKHIKTCPKNPDIINIPPCNFCNKAFTDKLVRKRHIENACSKNPNKIQLRHYEVLCNFCNKVLRSEEKRHDHIKHFCSMNENRTILKNTVCEFCKHSFSSQDNRNYHTKHICHMNPNKIVLERKNTVSCNLCNKGFVRKANRDRHVCEKICAMKKKKLNITQTE